MYCKLKVKHGHWPFSLCALSSHQLRCYLPAKEFAERFHKETPYNGVIEHLYIVPLGVVSS